MSNTLRNGQKVVCVSKAQGQPILVGKTYTVKQIKKDCCGDNVVDVGISEPQQVGSKIKCPGDKHWVINDGIWWFLEARFVPLEEIPASHQAEIKKLIEESLLVEYV